jgi:hypothetical protein
VAESFRQPVIRADGRAFNIVQHRAHLTYCYCCDCERRIAFVLTNSAAKAAQVGGAARSSIRCATSLPVMVASCVGMPSGVNVSSHS